MKKGTQVRLSITDMTSAGEGIGHSEGYTFFVAGGIIGDEVLAEVTLPRKTYAYASVKKMITPSPDRVSARCPVSGTCGGCQLQELSYEAQLRWKKRLVTAALSRIGGLKAEIGEENRVEDVVGMEDPWRYRNKTQFPVGPAEGGPGTVFAGGCDAGRNTPGAAAGYYERRSHRIVPCEDCPLSRTEHSRIRDIVLEFMEEYRIAPYDETTGQGLVRHILIREGFATGQIMVCLVINGAVLPSAAFLAERLRGAFPRIASVCVNINRKRNNVILGEEVEPVFGEPFIEDRIGDLTYRISPLSFYQINPLQTKKLYDTVKEFAALTGEETVLDLFCGIGTIGLYLADRAKAVYGVEVVPDAVRDAAENARRNNIENAHFFVGQSENIAETLPEADVIVVDPPRKGCEEVLVRTLNASAASRLIYVSCNPATLARDLKLLTQGEGSWRLERVRPFDMFPQTGHVETCVLLVRESISFL